jgi:hypothetical protein
MVRASQRPPSPAAREEAIAQSLVSALAKLAVLPDSPLRRELRAAATLYENTVRGWKDNPPPDGEIERMVDLVVALHKKVLAAKKADPIVIKKTPARSRRASNRPRT